MYVVISVDPNSILWTMLMAALADLENKLLNKAAHNTQTGEAIVHTDEG